MADQPIINVVVSDGEEDDVILFPDEDAEGLHVPSKNFSVGNLQPDDSESDSSEDEPLLNRVGDVPAEWYQDEEHAGYDIEGNKVMKPQRSALDQLLDATDDPNALRTIIDTLHGSKKVLSNADLELIFNLQRNRTPNAAFDMYADYPDTKIELDPLNHPFATNGPSKKRFVPAPHEMKRIHRIARRIMREQAEKRKTGLFQEPETKEDDEKAEYMLWDDNAPTELDTRARFRRNHSIPKPAMIVPGTYESYNPPAEYIPSERTKLRFQRTRKIDRKEHFLPQQFACLRHVPFYHHTVEDRYQRCLDLAVFPRAQRTRLVVDPKELLPELPDPHSLRPFPERLSFLYKGHTGTVRSISVSPSGQYLATGCDDHLVRIYEILTGRLMKRFDMGGVVTQLAFNPNPLLNMLLVAVEFTIAIIVPVFCACEAVNEHTLRLLRAPHAAPAHVAKDHVVGGTATTGGSGIKQTVADADETAYEPQADLHDEAEKERRADFVDANAIERSSGIIVKVAFHARVKRITLHAKGDYVCALCPKDHVKYRQTVMLQLSRRKVFCPFRKFSEVVTDCRFHPTEPQFFLATTNAIRCYNLLMHRLAKKFSAQGGVTSCIDIHPGGDNFLLGDTTNHTCWYDVDFSERPFRRMRSHKSIVNAVAYHPNTDAYPLFASGSSDGHVHVFHGMVYDDLNKNALIVPVKILKHHRAVYSIAWHPTLPWVFTATEDGTVSCWTE